jgi:hypothetical protein
MKITIHSKACVSRYRQHPPCKNAIYTNMQTTKSATSYSIRIAGPSSLSSAKLVFLPPFSPSSPTSFVHIHVDAYIFTLCTHTLAPLSTPPLTPEQGIGRQTYRSIQLPGTLTATLLQLNPASPKTLRYHGSRPALLSMTLPRTFNARFSARICLSA